MSTEKYVNFFERLSLCLRHEEVDEWNRECEACCEDEICSIANVRNHVWHRSSDYEVEEPVRCCADGHSEATDADREDLRAVDPRNTSVREAESNGEYVDEGDSCVPSSGKMCGTTRLRDLDVCSDKPHSDEHDYSAAHEHVPATKSVDDVVHGDDDADESDDSIDASCVETRGLSLETDRLEDARRKVVDGV